MLLPVTRGLRWHGVTHITALRKYSREPAGW
jgi:hypothetical protein